MRLQRYQTKKCLVCGREYYAYLKNKRRGRTTNKMLRRHNSKTCSSECSKEWADKLHKKKGV